jgi:membrane protein DedA with SNARE-associated domain
MFERGTAFLKRFGSLALSLAAFLPPPFPTSAFVVAAGATRYRFVDFLLAFGTGRVCRFMLLAYLASVFGRRLVTKAWSGHMLAVVMCIGGVLVSCGVLAWLAFRKSELVR